MKILLSTKEISWKYKVSPSTVRSWASRYSDFPLAICRDIKDNFSKLYDIVEVNSWFKRQTKDN